MRLRRGEFCLRMAMEARLRERHLIGASGKVMNLSGVDFERLVLELLKHLGFSAEMTKTTGDGGIDIEAVLDRPIVGGRYLVQCKRFAIDTLVGSPAVREFYGALVADRKAAKGILITTSDFSAQARDFAKDLPIELINGTDLTKLLAQMSRDT